MTASCCRCRRSFAKAARASWEEIAQGLELTGHFLMRDLLTDRSQTDRRSAKQAGRPVAPRRWSRLGSDA